MWPSTTAFFTAVIAFATIAYVIVTKRVLRTTIRALRANIRAARANRVSARAAKRSAEVLAISQRPHLTIKNFYLERYRIDEKDPNLIHISIGFNFVNFGITPGWPVRMTAYAKVHKSSQLEGEPLPNYAHSVWSNLGGVIVPHEIAPMFHSDPKHNQMTVTRSDLREVEKGELNLFVYGVVLYHDGLNPTLCQSHFAMRYAAKHSPFYWVVMNQDYWGHT